jgi:hypothetical protein
MLVALAMVVMIGAGTASATTICTSGTTTAPCPSGQKPFTGLVKAELVEGLLGPAELISGFAQVKCKDSKILATVTAPTGAVEVEGLTLNECANQFSLPCTATTTAGTGASAWPATVSVTSAPNGQMKVKNVEGTVSCSGVTCIYGIAEATGISGIGGTPAIIKFEGVKLEKKAGSHMSCSASSFLSGEYKVTAPTSLFVQA